jgi:hypothetical protein
MGTLQIIGVLIIVNALVIACYVYPKYPTKATITLAALAIATGYLLLIADRITEAKLPFLGTFKAKAEQALVDADTVTKLRERVEAQAATVDLVAKQATDAKKLSEEAGKRIEAADSKLSELDKTIDAGKQAQQRLEALTDFQSTVLAAQNDSRSAYMRLWELANTPHYQYSQFAAQAYQTIMDAHTSPMRTMYDITSMGISPDPTKFDKSGIVQVFRGTPDPTIRIALLQYLRKRDDLTKSERMAIFILTLQNDPSVNVAAEAGTEFATDSGDHLKSLAIPQHVQWWELHHDEIK